MPTPQEIRGFEPKASNFTERATDVLLGELKDTAHDLATVLEVLIKSERGYSPEEPVTVKDNVIK